MTRNKALSNKLVSGFKVKHYQEKVPRVIADLNDKIEKGVDNRAAFQEIWQPLPGHIKCTYRQRRIAHAQNLCCEYRCTDLKTGIVGYPVVGLDGTRRMRPYTNKQLVKRNQLHVRRMQRSTAGLKILGIKGVSSAKPRSTKLTDGTHHGFPAARRANLEIFYRFGLGKELEDALEEDAKEASRSAPPEPAGSSGRDGPSPEAIARAMAANAALKAKPGIDSS